MTVRTSCIGYGHTGDWLSCPLCNLRGDNSEMTHMTESDLATLLRANPDLHADNVKQAQRKPIAATIGSDALTHQFEALWALLGGPALLSEYRFHPQRKWRFDYAFLPAKVAIEIEGGLWSGGRHVRPLGFRKDVEKYNAAQLLGWRVFRLTTGQVTAEHIEPIINAITENPR